MIKILLFFQIIKHLIRYGVNLRLETVETINEFLGDAKNDVMHILQNLIK